MHYCSRNRTHFTFIAHLAYYSVLIATVIIILIRKMTNNGSISRGRTYTRGCVKSSGINYHNEYTKCTISFWVLTSQSDTFYFYCTFGILFSVNCNRYYNFNTENDKQGTISRGRTYTRGCVKSSGINYHNEYTKCTISFWVLTSHSSSHDVTMIREPDMENYCMPQLSIIAAINAQ